MITSANFTQKKSLTVIAAVSLSVAAIFGLQGCSSSGGGSSDTTTPGISVSSASIVEGDSGSTNLAFTVTLSATSNSDVSVAYTTNDGTATVGDDYTLTTGTLTIPANSTSATINVPIIGDTNIELDESFNLEISNAQNATITNSTQTVAGTIITDDSLAGYYTGSAAIDVAAGNLVVADGNIQVIADAETLAIIDLTDNLIYIASLSAITSADFTATARVYKDGDFIRTTDIAATFTAGASVNLTLTGTGDYTTGTVTLAYSAKNSVAPLVFVDNQQWFIPFGTSILFNGPTNIDIATTGDVQSTALDSCRSSNISLINIVSEQTGRIRSFAAATDLSCTDPNTNETTLNGYFTTFDDTLIDDSMLFIWFNDFGAYAAILPKQ